MNISVYSLNFTYCIFHILDFLLSLGLTESFSVFRYVAIEDELPQRPSWPCCLPASQRAHVTNLHPPHGEDRHVLLDGAQSGGSEHHLCGHRPPQPARLADHLPLWVALVNSIFLCFTKNMDLFFFFCFLVHHCFILLSLNCVFCFILSRLCRVCFPGAVFG